MRTLAVVLLLVAGCSGVDVPSDLGGGPDIARGPGYHPDLGGQDLARGDMAESQPGDMAEPARDLTTAPACNAVPPCSATPLPNGTLCCNGASCINGTCWNPPGAYCCTTAGCNPQVACWQSASASGVCGTNNRCM